MTEQHSRSIFHREPSRKNSMNYYIKPQDEAMIKFTSTGFFYTTSSKLYSVVDFKDKFLLTDWDIFDILRDELLTNNYVRWVENILQNKFDPNIYHNNPEEFH